MTHLDCSCEVHGERDDGTGRHSVYLTFDDGPHPFCTPEILDILAEHRVPATFFVIGEFLADQSKLIQRMIAEGHEVANHTMTHPDLSDCEPDEVQRQILETNRAIKNGVASGGGAAHPSSLRHLDRRSAQGFGECGTHCRALVGRSARLVSSRGRRHC